MLPLANFELHPQLLRDTLPVGRMRLSRLLLMNDANYPWFILVPERPGISEWFELPEVDQQLLLQESMALSRALKQLFQPDKINVAALGNVVPQLHLHHVARYRQDPAWPAPVWGARPTIPYEGGAWQPLIDQMSQHLGEQLTPW